MLRSLYSGVTGLKSFQTKLDVIGNNVANVNTVGFKKSRVMFQDILSQSIGNSGTNPMQVGLGTSVSAIDVLHTQGSPMQTGIATDLAIQGEGFFVVEKTIGTDTERLLTRAGNFIFNSSNQLVTTNGYKVLGADQQPISIADRNGYFIDEKGVIRNKGSETEIATLGYYTQPNPEQLEKAGSSTYKFPDGGIMSSITGAGSDAVMVTGRLEMSNVDLTEEFTEMIIAQRGFQSTSKIISTSDEILQEIVNLKR